jgi:allantoate deiminase
VRAYVELHIEQGRVLENEDLPAGVVTGIAGPVWLRFSIEGETGHAGATPMSLRRDALAASAEIMGLIEAEVSGTGTSVGTVGQLSLEPGGINIIPGRVEFSLDLRDIDEEVRDRVEARILGEWRRSASGAGWGWRSKRCNGSRPPRARNWSRTPWRGLARGWASAHTRSPAARGTTGCSSRTSARWA